MREAAPGFGCFQMQHNLELNSQYPWPIFLFITCNTHEPQLAGAAANIHVTVYLFDAIEGCRLSEEFPIRNASKGVFRISSRPHVDRGIANMLDSKEHVIRSTMLGLLQGVFLVVQVSQFITQ